METLKLILICVLIVIGIILFFLLIFYLIGNIYNGLVRRRMRVKSSWYEINKLFTKFFEILPEVIKTSTNKEFKKNTKCIYQNWNNLKNKDDILFIAKEYYKFLEIYSKNNDLQSDNDIYLFIEKYIDKINFSIPFYNENVENYNHFRKLPVNIIMAKIFKFYPATPIEF